MLEVNYKYVSEELRELTVARRRDFHGFPEEGWTEYRTSAKVADVLKALGYEVKTGTEVCDSKSRMGMPSDEILKECENRALEEGVSPEYLDQMRGGHTGVIGILRGDKPGKVTALRFDMDALPIEEKTDRPYCSKHAQVMHACGHDGHTAAGLAVAQCLAEHKDRIKGEIRIIFQPAEEGCRGAQAVVKKGWLDDVDVFLSGHIGISCRHIGEIQACAGGFFATTKMNLTFHGETAHAGKVPELGRNALLAAAVFTENAYAISRSSVGETRINVGKFISGNGRNIIADHAYLELETRGTTSDANAYMETAVEGIAEGVSRMYQVSYTLETVGSVGSAKSDEALVNQLRECAVDMKLEAGFRGDAYMGASEDAVAMMQCVQEHGGQAAYFLFGSELAAEHHQDRFDFNEQVLGIMTEFYARAILDSH